MQTTSRSKKKKGHSVERTLIFQIDLQGKSLISR
ncbi:hypothetical protein NC651_008452 [Populus alba x Populus x berolinensis]|nr:hypothetical protein NC651_008452 [Populus alba x Populus x berolinensis]